MPDKVASDLAKAVRGDVFTDIVHRVAYSTDASIYQIIPVCVVAPRDATDVAAVVKYVAAKGIPVVARGAGTGVAGEALCSGVVFDMARYMRDIISFGDNGELAVCEPGVVLEDLNGRLAEYGRKIGPDPSSGNRATVGGCVANNAAGAHSLQYGYMADYIESVETVLADGSLIELQNDFAASEAQDEKLGSIGKKCMTVLSEGQEIIRKAVPEGKSNRSGYCVAGVCHDGRIDLARLAAGSEGTLGVFTKISIRTVAVPPVKALLQLQFSTLAKMAKAVPIIVKSGASACELMDKTLIDMAIETLTQYRDVFPVGAAAILLVEHVGATAEEVEEKIKSSDSAVGNLASERRIVYEPAEQQRLWKARKDAVPLLERRKGAKHAVPFIEDVLVGNERLGKYITRLKKIAKKYDVAMSFYGHAGDGELHIRPYMDLSEPDEVEKMRAVAEDVFSLAWSLGGTMSAEHGDGLVRAAFIKRQYGEDFYELLRKIKNIFDPDGLMNPGKIINDDVNVMVKNLRAEHRFLPERLKTNLAFDGNELRFELEQCSGCGACLSTESDLRACPVFRALGDELSSSRAKANVLRSWATGRIEREDFESPEFRKFLDLCVNCKACSLECPSGVDVSKLMVTARAEYVRHKGLRCAESVLSRNRYLSLAASVFAPVSNWLMSLGFFKWLLERTTGLDRRRAMPEFGRRSFVKAGRKYLASCEPIEKPVDRIAYFVDTYANYNDHELGFAVLEVLRANGIDVVLPKQRPAPLPAICYGDVKTARRELAYSVKHLAKLVRDGYKVVCSEPSAALCLRNELRHFVTGDDARLVSENTYELMSYLSELSKRGKLKPVKEVASRSYVYHCPCHLYALGAGRASIGLLKGLGPVRIAELDAGCCGLAGTFGMQKKNYELSSKIAARLKEALAQHPACYVLTECSACKMQIEHLSGATVLHPIKVLAEAYS
ncbi:MAG: anaerobic glycerol-3-phosphate dehydrogenase subunit C [Planctomycetota bacterium]|nr:MAG: anaerobic glycerol-3-phosphate dehydrogenase subunit C [Planctomycetota bacterium]